VKCPVESVDGRDDAHELSTLVLNVSAMKDVAVASLGFGEKAVTVTVCCRFAVLLIAKGARAL
jgi:hypothetical protein